MGWVTGIYAELSVIGENCSSVPPSKNPSRKALLLFNFVVGSD